MLTSNGKALLKINSTNTRIVNSKFKLTSGNDRTLGGQGEYVGLMTSLTAKLGSGTTEPTADDYSLETPDSNLSLSLAINTANTDTPSYEQNYIFISQVTYKNNTNESITVSEIGVIGTITGYGDVLITRDTFKPITIEPNKSYNFSVTIG